MLYRLSGFLPNSSPGPSGHPLPGRGDRLLIHTETPSVLPNGGRCLFLPDQGLGHQCRGDLGHFHGTFRIARPVPSGDHAHQAADGEGDGVVLHGFVLRLGHGPGGDKFILGLADGTLDQHAAEAAALQSIQ